MSPQMMNEAEFQQFRTEIMVPILTKVIVAHTQDVDGLASYHRVLGAGLQNVKVGLSVGAAVYERASLYLMRHQPKYVDHYLTAERLAATGIAAGIFLGKQEGLQRIKVCTPSVFADRTPEATYPGMFSPQVYTDVLAEAWMRSSNEAYPNQTSDAILMAMEDLAEWAAGVVGDFTAFIRAERGEVNVS